MANHSVLRVRLTVSKRKFQLWSLAWSQMPSSPCRPNTCYFCFSVLACLNHTQPPTPQFSFSLLLGIPVPPQHSSGQHMFRHNGLIRLQHLQALHHPRKPSILGVRVWDQLFFQLAVSCGTSHSVELSAVHLYLHPFLPTFTKHQYSMVFKGCRGPRLQSHLQNRQAA